MMAARAAAWAFALCAFLGPGAAGGAAPPVYGRLPDFSLTESAGRNVSRSDLAGGAWLVNFIFTRCRGPCPLLSRRFAHLQKTLPADLRLLSISVDPEYDTPRRLSDYARGFGAERGRWLFLTGERDPVYRLIREGFLVGAEPNPQARDSGEAFVHSLKFVLLDADGNLRGYYDGLDPEDLRRIPRDLRALRLAGHGPLVSRLPAWNAGLNAVCSLFLLAGFRFIRAGRARSHRLCMVAALAVSLLFLVSYLYYHSKAGSVPFLGEGWLRPFYFALLVSHSVLAALVLPLALASAYYAWKLRFGRHVRLTRWVYPAWLYVSFSGIAVYWMLYRM